MQAETIHNPKPLIFSFRTSYLTLLWNMKIYKNDIWMLENWLATFCVQTSRQQGTGWISKACIYWESKAFQRRDGLIKYTLVKLQERRIIRDQLTVNYLKSWYRAKKYRVEGLGDSSVRKNSVLPAVTKGERPLYLLSDSSFSGKVTQSFVVTFLNKR